MVNDFVKFIRLIFRFGIIQGMKLHFCNCLGSIIKKISIKNVKFPFYLRQNIADAAIFDEVFLNLDYEYELNFKPEFIIDCGANIGLASIYFKNIYPDVTIIAIEPDKSNYNMLIKNVENYPDIYCINAGIWNKETFLKVEDKFNKGAACYICSEVSPDFPGAVKSYSISDILKIYNQTEIDILKIDVEGSEKEIFQSGYEEWLPKTKSIMIELHDYFNKGCSKSFFTALINYDFSLNHEKRNLFCVKE